MTDGVQRLLLGVVADDMTGGTDAAASIAAMGLRVVQLIGLPDESAPLPEDCDAVVVSLKSRTAPVATAVEQTLIAARWLHNHGAGQIALKICSTFDSTPAGNIGPAADALRAVLDAGLVPVTPANPENERTVYQGHLFVSRQLLQESSMATHPLTPMCQSDVVSLLQEQTASPVALLPLLEVRAGVDAVRAALEKIGASGAGYVVIDALEDDDLDTVVAASGEAPLWVGASGLVRAVAAVLGEGRDGTRLPTDFSAVAPGPTLCVSGSSSEATREQVARFREHVHAVRLDPLTAAEDSELPRRLGAELLSRLNEGHAALLYATADPTEVVAVRKSLGAQAGDVVEAALAAVVAHCVAGGIRRIVVAGGETSGAVLNALGVRSLRIGSVIAPGVPWTVADIRPAVALALKSGNFGGPDFFLEACGGKL